ncbi:uncharacterized protein [Pempheris klunzingeri]|uniref:uncharacterized protein isoform X2 n=1 Tax=Pempheris klunzingeri TaxID=3127111 RepID=UPI00397F5F6F
MVQTEKVPEFQPRSLYNPPQTSKLHLVQKPAAWYSPSHIGSREKTLPDTQKSVSTEPMSTRLSRVNENLQRSGSIERRNIETVKSRLKSIRVKPPSKFLSSGHHVSLRPVLLQVDSQTSNPSLYAQYETGPAAASAHGNRWSQQLPEHRLDRRVRVKPDRPAVIRLNGQPPEQQQLVHPEQQGQKLKLVHSVSETGNYDRPESAFAHRNVLQPSGLPHVRVRLVSSLSGRLQTHNERKLQNLNPSAGGTGYTGSHTGTDGSGGSSSDLRIHSRSACSQSGASVHQGIVRGKRTS